MSATVSATSSSNSSIVVLQWYQTKPQHATTSLLPPPELSDLDDILALYSKKRSRAQPTDRQMTASETSASDPSKESRGTVSVLRMRPAHMCQRQLLTYLVQSCVPQTFCATPVVQDLLVGIRRGTVRTLGEVVYLLTRFASAFGHPLDRKDIMKLPGELETKWSMLKSSGRVVQTTTSKLASIGTSLSLTLLNATLPVEGAVHRAVMSIRQAVLWLDKNKDVCAGFDVPFPVARTLSLFSTDDIANESFVTTITFRGYGVAARAHLSRGPTTSGATLVLWRRLVQLCGLSSELHSPVDYAPLGAANANGTGVQRSGDDGDSPLELLVEKSGAVSSSTSSGRSTHNNNVPSRCPRVFLPIYPNATTKQRDEKIVPDMSALPRPVPKRAAGGSLTAALGVMCMMGSKPVLRLKRPATTS
eukprot:PhM_4_TR722/c0_g4_i1/m.47949